LTFNFQHKGVSVMVDLTAKNNVGDRARSLSPVRASDATRSQSGADAASSTLGTAMQQAAGVLPPSCGPVLPLSGTFAPRAANLVVRLHDLPVGLLSKVSEDFGTADLLNFMEVDKQCRKGGVVHVKKVKVTSPAELQLALNAFKEGGLESITLSGINGMFTDEDLAKLPANLKCLHMKGFPNVSDEALSRFTQLEELSVGLNSRLTGACLEGMRSLRVLNAVCAMHLTDDAIANCTSLEALDISGNTQLRGAGFGKLKLLRTLKAEGAAGLLDTTVATMTSLESLDITECFQLSGFGFAALTSLKILKATFALGLTNDAIAGMSALRELSVEGSRLITGAGFEALPLRVLNCRYATGFNNARIAALTGLEFLNIEGCTELTGAGFDALTQLKRLFVGGGAQLLPAIRETLTARGCLVA
jgi:hypothetical protein